MLQVVNRLVAVIDRATDHVGDALFLGYAAVAVAAIVACVVLAVTTTTWALLAILALPAFWLYMWWSS